MGFLGKLVCGRTFRERSRETATSEMRAAGSSQLPSPDRARSSAPAAWLIVLLSAQLRAADPSPPAYSATDIKTTIVENLPPPIPNAYHALGDYIFAVQPLRGNFHGDFNGDGLEDILVAPNYATFQPQLPIQIWINQGNGTFVDQTSTVIEGPITVTGAATSIFVADFNGDGRPDVFFVDSGLEDKDPSAGFDGGINHVLLSQPNGKLKDVTSDSLPQNVFRFNHVSSIGDVNGDGTLDIVLTVLGGRTGGAGTLFLLNDGRGVFTSTSSGLPLDIAYYPSGPWWPAAPDPQLPGSNGVLDLDGDGRLDLVTGTYSLNDPVSKKRSVRFFQQRPDHSFVERSRIEIPLALANIGYRGGTVADSGGAGLGVAGITGADLDEDGRTDVVVLWEGASASYIQILRNEGNFVFTDKTLDWLGTYDTNVVAGGLKWSASAYDLMDVNGDGHIDLVRRGAGYDAATLWNGGFAFLNDGTGHLKPLAYRTRSSAAGLDDFIGALGCSYCAYTPFLFDATGDGQIDLVLLDISSGNSGRWTPEKPFRDKELYLHVFSGQGSLAGLSASFSYGPSSPAAGTPVGFTDTSSGATSREWKFGDGGTSTSAQPLHTYSAPGLYTVQMTARNGTQAMTASRRIAVTLGSTTRHQPVSGPPGGQPVKKRP